MLCFAVTGAIGCVLETASDELTLALSCPLERADKPLQVVWVLGVARDGALRARILEAFRGGDVVRVEGAIEARRRQLGALAFHSVGFVIRSIELASPSFEGES